MDVLLKNYFWVVNLLVIALCASLGGRAAAHLARDEAVAQGQRRAAALVVPVAQEKGEHRMVDRVRIFDQARRIVRITRELGTRRHVGSNRPHPADATLRSD